MYKEFKADAHLERTGAWVEFYDSDTGKNDFRVLLRHATRSSKEYNKAVEKYSRSMRRGRNAQSLEHMSRVRSEVLANYLIMKWERWFDVPTSDNPNAGEWRSGIEAEDGSTLDFTPKNVLDTLLELPELADELQVESEKISNFQEGEEADLETDQEN